MKLLVFIAVLKMEVEFKSDWLVIQIELLKAIHGYEKNGVNDEIGSINYVASGDGDEKKLLRVIIDRKDNISKANTDTIRTTIEFLENEDYDKAVILSEEFTEGAKSLIRKKKNLNYIFPELHPHSIPDIVYATQIKTGELCKLRCGKVPKTERDCKGYQDGEYTCPVRRISDDADFHAERKWLQLLMNDFSKLVTLWRELIE